MKLDQTISELLYTYDYVVIPELGGLVSSEVSASIHPVTYTFRPPSKKIVFNPDLQTNDGLLINTLAANEKLDYKEARSRVSEWVSQLKNQMHNGSKVSIRNVGYFYRDAEQNICFVQDETINYLTASFGLGSFISPAILRNQPNRKITHIKPIVPSKTDETKEEWPSEKRKGIWLTGFAAASIALLIFASIFYTAYQFRPDMYRSYAFVIPFFKDSDKPNSDPVKTYKHEESNVLKASEEKTETKDGAIAPTDNQTAITKSDHASEAPINTGPVDSPQMKASAKLIPDKPETVNEKLAFHIIIGSFTSRQNAEKLIQELNKKQYRASVAGISQNGLFRVSIASFGSKSEALQQLAAIRKEENPAAWLLKTQ